LLKVMAILKLAVFISLIISLVVLTAQVLQTLSFGRRRLHSEAGGKPREGIAYALGRGMLPWEKESAARHLPTYVAGMVYHAGIFSAVLYAFCLTANIPLPQTVLTTIQFLLAAGFLSGTGLLLKRMIHSKMRYISCPDDYASNLLVDAFMFSGLLSSWLASAAPVFLILAVLTFLYMPLGKVRHCFFFFYSRILFGSYFGRRGVLPRRRTAKA
jgi:nitrate reductase gamma subunit